MFSIAVVLPPAFAEVTVTDIGTINNRSSIGLGINTAGDVAGFSYFTGTIGVIGGPPAEPFLAHGVLFSNGTLTDLGAIEGGAICSPLGCESRAIDINGSRWIVGWNDGDYGLWAVLWLPEPVPGGVAGYNVLPPLSPVHGSIAYSINDTGTIVGLSSPDGVAGRPVRWELTASGATISDLGTLRSDGGGYGVAYSVNSLGQIVGGATDDAYRRKGFLYLPAPAYGLPAGMHDLMAGVDRDGDAIDINSKGEVVGGADLGMPWVWLPAPAYGLPAGFSYLPLTGRIVAFFPTAISDAGQIAGQVYVEINPRTREFVREAAVWRNGQWKLLNDTLPPRSPWELLSAEDIERDGKTTRITGGGLLSGVTDVNGQTPVSHGYVITVTCTGDLDEDGDVDADDQKIVLAHLGESVPPSTGADVNGDGIVNEMDLKELALQIHKPCL
jgi:hypothetical protein